MSLTNEKIKTLCEIEGYTDPVTMASEAMFSDRAGSPAICMNEDCDYTTYMEPDQDRGWCDECGTNTVKSIEVLLGVI